MTGVQTCALPIYLAYLVKNDRERGGWVVAVGKGFAFSLNGRLDQ